MRAAEVLRELAQTSNAAAHSSVKLLGEVEAVAARDDKERKENELEALRRRSGLQPIPTRELGTGVELTPWHVLHALGRAIALSRRGAGRGLAEHWGCLKYTQALAGTPGTFMTLSVEGRDTADYDKTAQSDELEQSEILFLLPRQREEPAHHRPDRHHAGQRSAEARPAPGGRRVARPGSRRRRIPPHARRRGPDPRGARRGRRRAGWPADGASAAALRLRDPRGPPVGRVGRSYGSGWPSSAKPAELQVSAQPALALDRLSSERHGQPRGLGAPLTMLRCRA